MLRIGVIGAGRISRIHIENLTHHVSKADVVAVADPHLQAAEKAADPVPDSECISGLWRNPK